MFKRLLLLSLILLFTCQPMLGQVTRMPRDTTKVYSYIERYSKKRKFTKFVHRLIFRPTERTNPTKKKKQTRQQQNIFKKHECKIIRNINIEVLDPFGFAIDNPNKIPKKWIEKAGNSMHTKSKKWAIRNHLLFKKNDELDSLLVKESERLIQRQRYIRNVSIKPVPIPNSKDSVDISITVLDSWSLIPNGSISSSNGNLEITERNFLGLGHEFENNFRQRFTDNTAAYGMRYIIPNFRNTFISTVFHYDEDFDKNHVKAAGINRVFFSPFTRWAGGIAFEQRFYRDSLSETNDVMALKNFKLETQDYWAGHSFRIFKGNTEDDRITNLVTTLRFRNIKYPESPELAYDPIDYFSNSRLYLASIGITSRRFVENKYLFNYGIPEYVQIGKTYAITSGFEEKNSIRRNYFGGRFSFGGFHNFGYFGSNFELGSFFNDGASEQTTFRAEALYFTDLIEYGNWKFRQFIKPQLTIGNNRIPTKSDLLNLSDPNGIEGFQNSIQGTKKLLVTFQTQSYIPGNYLGFRMSPFANFSMGMIAHQNENLLKTPLYSKFGIGVLISNDYLVFNSFLLSFAYYPTIPGTGDNIFKLNSFKNNDIDLFDYQIGKPAIVPFQ
ncbi:hypothetical protein FSS13T_20340 [Flavobacterium saliperosum S13]|nr:hypothetical protein [Flavobacterium saliperosum]ESU24065.1 hypothetical protein FSS13T_20340 [Flavobacterium saliperosum S13]